MCVDLSFIFDFKFVANLKVIPVIKANLNHIKT